VLDRGVSFVVDGVYIAGNIQGADLDDLEAVEVLKGPQAANFGRGSLAGVISYRTRKPTREWSGRLSASAGEDGFAEASGFISGPLWSDTLSFKLGARYYDFDGQYTGVSSDGSTPRFGSEHSERVSAALRWEPSERFDATLRAFSAQNSDGLYVWYLNPTLNCFTGPATGPTRGGSYCGVQPTIPLHGAIRVDYADIARQGKPGQTSDTVLLSGEANWNFGSFTVTGLVSWNRQDEDWIIDDYLIGTSATNRSQTPGPTMTIANPGGVNRVITIRECQSQELRVAFNSESKWSWMAGAYNYSQDDLSSNGPPEYNILTTAGLPATTNTGPVGTLKRVTAPAIPSAVRNQAVFAQLIYDATDSLHLAFEGRYARDEISSQRTGATRNCPLNLKGTYESFTPRASVRFDFTEEVNVYLSVAQGNKPGAFNTGLCGADIPAAEYARLIRFTPLEVDEEKTTNFEIGTKMRLLDGRMAIDAAIFFTDWTNQQVSQSQVYQPAAPMAPSTVSLISNAGETDVRGMEISWRFRAKAWPASSRPTLRSIRPVRARSSIVPSVNAASSSSGGSMPPTRASASRRSTTTHPQATLHASTRASACARTTGP
jgi:outer membrane receptor protein involved in Fe transport